MKRPSLMAMGYGLFFALLLLMLFAAVMKQVPKLGAETLSELPHGIYIDTTLWRGVALPDSVVLCHIFPDKSADCLVLPPGSVVLLPTHTPY